MATSIEAMEFILDKLGNRERFSSRKMFGEYALYADGKTVAFVCDDTLYVKIVPASEALAHVCEQGEAYPGSKPYYVVAEDQLDTIEDLPEILFDIAATIPAKKQAKPRLGVAKRPAKKAIRQSQRICNRGHRYRSSGPCPVCWPGHYARAERV